jgi:hypothetical protein
MFLKAHENLPWFIVALFSVAFIFETISQDSHIKHLNIVFKPWGEMSH